MCWHRDRRGGGRGLGSARMCGRCWRAWSHPSWGSRAAALAMIGESGCKWREDALGGRSRTVRGCPDDGGWLTPGGGVRERREAAGHPRGFGSGFAQSFWSFCRWSVFDPPVPGGSFPVATHGPCWVCAFPGQEPCLGASLPWRPSPMDVSQRLGSVCGCQTRFPAAAPESFPVPWLHGLRCWGG